jgi:hypothetical protein
MSATKRKVKAAVAAATKATDTPTERKPRAPISRLVTGLALSPEEIAKVRKASDGNVAGWIAGLVRKEIQ